MLAGFVATVVLLTTSAAQSADLTTVLEAARNAAREQRYQRVVELLQPHTEPLPAEERARFSIAAQLGRAHFHLAEYASAHRWIRVAASVQPQNIEVGIYRQASAYLSGHHDEAFAVFEQILRSGAQDLWLPMTLSGEDAFRTEPRVQALLEQYTRTLPIDLGTGALAGARLGQPRSDVVAAFGAVDVEEGRFVSARSGPIVLWSLEFDAHDQLIGIIVNVTGMILYSPLRPAFGGQLDWRAQPHDATAVLGPPIESHNPTGSLQTLTWQIDRVRTEMDFEVLPPHSKAGPTDTQSPPRMQTVRLRLISDDATR